jgi:hypothetical protein
MDSDTQYVDARQQLPAMCKSTAESGDQAKVLLLPAVVPLEKPEHPLD